MEKEFVPQEQSLELKELGFYEECFSYVKHLGYDKNKDKVQILSRVSRSQIEDMGLSLLKIPTFSQAFRFFREKYLLFGYSFPNDYQNYGYRIVEMTSDENKELVYDWGTKDTYEESELECLKKLIEIVKEK